MSRWIRLSDSRGRDARVRMEVKKSTPKIQFQACDGRPVKAAKLIKLPLQRSYTYLQSQCSNDREMTQLLIDSDPEIDMEVAGKKTGCTDRILLDPDGKVLYATSEVEVIYDQMGMEVERREPLNIHANIDTEVALRWTGKFFKREDAVRQFAFTRNYQIRHVDGLTYDFLYKIAEELDQADSLAVIGTGAKGHDPLHLERNGLPYRGFLEGRIKEDKYLLILHLTRLELQPPERFYS